MRSLPIGRTTALQAEYWNRVLAVWSDDRSARLWRQHSDQVNRELVTRWLPQAPIGRTLKTDLFDEAVGDGLCPLQGAVSMIGIDLSSTAVARAVVCHSRVTGIVADVRELPFKSRSFDFVMSISTLDHLSRESEIEDALAEFNRVLRPGGALVITMDNTRNPVVALRSMIQASLLRLGALPYFTGVSCDAHGLQRLLAETGFDVVNETTVLHSPRVLAVAVARLLDIIQVRSLGRFYLRLLGRFERLASSRTANVTGYFVAARAVKH
jgi:2-polyprenyl-3-methyl-5-hydroxy-6-metoxy-1,4-benzoquinol methylase